MMRLGRSRHAVVALGLGVALAVIRPAVAAEPAGAADAPRADPAPATDHARAPPVTGDAFNPYAPGSEMDEARSLGTSALQMLAALGMVLALVYIVLNFGLRRLMGARAFPSGRAVLNVVERLQVDSKHSVLVVKAAGEYLLLGATESGVSLISKLDGETVERLQRERAQAAPSMSPFLQKLLSRRGGPPAGSQGTRP
jgi:flagellar protein FliO/FliZ